MAAQLFKSIQMSMVDQAKDSAVTLANIKALRRESYLQFLPPTFKTSTKMDLRKSSLDSGFLFDQDRVKEALDKAERNASITFQQAAARALVKPRPVPGSPLVGRGPRPLPVPSSSHPPRPSGSHHRLGSSGRDRSTPPSRHRSSGPSSSATAKGRGQFFRK